MNVALMRGPIVRLELNVAPRILMVSENWITESSSLTLTRQLLSAVMCQR